MASKKEVKEYVKIQLEKVKKQKISYPDEREYINRYTSNDFIVAIFDTILRRDYGDWSMYIEKNIDKVAPAYIKQAVADMNEEIAEIRNKNKEIEKYNNSIDEKYKDFCTEMLLIGNGQLADFAKAFIDSLTEAK